MEILSGVERRRRWRLEEKLRIVAEVEAPGAVFAHVAQRHDVSRGQLWTWRRQVRNGDLAPAPVVPEFLPVRLLDGETGAAGHVQAADMAMNALWLLQRGWPPHLWRLARAGSRLFCRMEHACALMAGLVRRRCAR